MPRKFYCKLQIEWICNRILSQQKNVCDNFFCDRTNVRSKLLLLGHLPNLVGHCPMSDSNLQPCKRSDIILPLTSSSITVSNGANSKPLTFGELLSLWQLKCIINWTHVLFWYQIFSLDSTLVIKKCWYREWIPGKKSNLKSCQWCIFTHLMIVKLHFLHFFTTNVTFDLHK
jgi:hypothetical protein